jgi:hypothetical protein
MLIRPGRIGNPRPSYPSPPPGFTFVYDDGEVVTEDGQPILEAL